MPAREGRSRKRGAVAFKDPLAEPFAESVISDNASDIPRTSLPVSPTFSFSQFSWVAFLFGCVLAYGGSFLIRAQEYVYWQGLGFSLNGQYLMEIMTRWSQIKIRNVGTETPERLYVGESFIVHGEIYLDGMSPKDVQAEIYAGPLNQQGEFTSRQITVMEAEGTTSDGWHIFRGETDPQDAGRFGFTVRIVPRHPLLLDPHSLGLISWAD